MFWDRKKDEQVDDTVGRPSRRRKLNPELQKLINQEEEFLDQLYDGRSADSIETPYRYAAYATRIKTLLLSAHRYVAYTSDIGESFRPIAHPWLVRTAYGVSWAYIFGDVANEGYKAYMRNQRILIPKDEAYRSAVATPTGQDVDSHVVAKEGLRQHQALVKYGKVTSDPHSISWNDPEEDTLTPWPTKRIPLSEDYRSIMAERAVFQGLASMGLPAFTIHSVVRYSGNALKGIKSAFLRTWAPIGLGLSIVPFLPYVFDKPVEEAVSWSFRKAFLAIGGPEAVPKSEIEDSSVSRAIETFEERRHRRREERERRRAERQALLENTKEE
ncbi:hypothetical protein D8B26_004741 [Coccidioides posadasii str. Silveira]|uniref:Mitochondrial fission process protein 1 n=1 Tax=Coccidioides posadasii (strain RMSCC 757 / Silveira) TaxID=443226 RepID=E9D6R8_COCPS|nr:hypothetical protein CPSG_05577 [Coccidioides posadasii str. Silveira]QVM10078.1 hypothetical protein D8B26_004741 [Coccidioides posadasii str. Silveira]